MRAPARRLAVGRARRRQLLAPVGRVDNVYGDRNLFCSRCGPGAGRRHRACLTGPTCARPRPGRRRRRRHRRLVPRGRRSRGDARRPAARCRARDLVRERRPDLRRRTRSLGEQEAPLKIRELAGPRGRAAALPAAPDWRQWRWGLQFLVEVSAVAHAQRSSASTSRSTRATASRRCAPGPASYDHLRRGILQFYTDAKDFRARRRVGGADARVRLRPRRRGGRVRGSRARNARRVPGPGSPAASTRRATGPATRVHRRAREARGAARGVPLEHDGGRDRTAGDAVSGRCACATPTDASRR